jgi:hypothetical protein
MTYEMKALYCNPAKLKGLSEKLILSHYENNYGGAVKTTLILVRPKARLVNIGSVIHPTTRSVPLILEVPERRPFKNRPPRRCRHCDR